MKEMKWIKQKQFHGCPLGIPCIYGRFFKVASEIFTKYSQPKYRANHLFRAYKSYQFSLKNCSGMTGVEKSSQKPIDSLRFAQVRVTLKTGHVYQK